MEAMTTAELLDAADNADEFAHVLNNLFGAIDRARELDE